jgi:hypothetical protein
MMPNVVPIDHTAIRFDPFLSGPAATVEADPRGTPTPTALEAKRAAAAGAGITFLDDAELLSQPEPLMQVDGLIPQGSQLVIVGPSGIGKTTLLVGLALSVAATQDFLGHRVVSAGPVVYLALEGVSAVRSRVLSAKTAGGWRLDESVGIHVCTEPLQLAELDDVVNLCLAAAPLCPSMLIVDTLARAAVGLDENSASDIGRVIGGLDTIRRRLDCTVVLAHHTTKSGSSERGSSALRGAVDGLWLLSEADDIITLECAKSRDAEPFQPIELRRVRTADGGVVLRRAFEAPTAGEVTPKQAMILDVLRASFGGAGASVKELLDVLPTVPRPSMFRCLKSLTDSGRLSHSGTTYRLGGA